MNTTEMNQRIQQLGGWSPATALQVSREKWDWVAGLSEDELGELTLGFATGTRPGHVNCSLCVYWLDQQDKECSDCPLQSCSTYGPTLFGNFDNAMDVENHTIAHKAAEELRDKLRELEQGEPA